MRLNEHFQVLRAVPAIAAFKWWLPYAATPVVPNTSEDELMTNQEIYDATYKKATGEGEHNKGAHHQALEAVYNEALRRAKLRPWRFRLHRWAGYLEKKLRP